MGHALARAGLKPQVDFSILDAAEAEERSWNRRWHSLRLFTPARHSGLPGAPFPGPRDRYPRTDEVAGYLELYASQFGLVPTWDTQVQSVRVNSHGHELTLITNHGELAALNVVAATGAFAEPRFPDFAIRASVDGENLHSDVYTHPKQIPAGSILIVGSGNTGRQLAQELAGSHQVTLAVGNPQRELPQRILGLDIFSWMNVTGALRIPTHSPIGRLLSGSEVVIGNRFEELTEVGVRIVSRVVDAVGPRFELEDGDTVEPHSVLWATGYRPGFDWLPQQARGKDGGIVQRRGATPIPGLYVLGLPWMHTRGSALLTGVGRDAARIARMIGRRP